jgi:hypothetical protein
MKRAMQIQKDLTIMPEEMTVAIREEIRRARRETQLISRQRNLWVLQSRRELKSDLIISRLIINGMNANG